MRHAGTLKDLTIEFRGHPTIAPTDSFTLNGASHKVNEVAAIEMKWVAVPGIARLPAVLSSVEFHFRDGSVVTPALAVVTALSFTLDEDGAAAAPSWAYRAGRSVAHRWGAVPRIEFPALPAIAPPIGPVRPLPPAAVQGVSVHVEGTGMAPTEGRLVRLRLHSQRGEALDVLPGGSIDVGGESWPVAMLASVRFEWAGAGRGRFATAVLLDRGNREVRWPGSNAGGLALIRLDVEVVNAPALVYAWVAGRPAPNQGELTLVRFAPPVLVPGVAIPPQSDLPRGVLAQPRGCPCGLGATPGVKAIVLRWRDLCPERVQASFGLVAPAHPSYAYATYAPTLYRADHGLGDWKRLGPSAGWAPSLSELALEPLALDPTVKEMYRETVRHWKNPWAYVEFPLPPGKTADEEAEKIKTLAWVVLSTRFGWRLDLLEPMGVGYVDKDVLPDRSYDYLLTVRSAAGAERTCGRVDGVSLIALPTVPAPAGLVAQAIPTTMPDAVDAPRPDPLVTPIALTWVPAPPAPPAPLPLGKDAYDVLCYFVQRMDVTAGGPWTLLDPNPTLQVSRVPDPTTPPGAPPDLQFRKVDFATEHLHTYRYRVFAVDAIGRPSVPTNLAEATAYRVTKPVEWKSFTADWNAGAKRVDVRLDLVPGTDPALDLWLERTVPGPKGEATGRVRLNSTAPWHASTTTLSYADSGVGEKTTYVYEVVLEDAGSASKRETGLRATVAVPDLTPPPAIDFVNYAFEEGKPLPDSVTDALVKAHHEDQLDEAKWKKALADATAEIEAEKKAWLDKSKSSDETVVLPEAVFSTGIDWLEVALSPLEGKSPAFAAAPMRFPALAEVVFKSGARIPGFLEAIDVEGPSLSGHAFPPAPLSCDADLVPWADVLSVDFLWRSRQPLATDPVKRVPFVTIAREGAPAAIPHVFSGTTKSAAGATRLRVRLWPTTPEGRALSLSLTGNADVFDWTYEQEKATAIGLEPRGLRFLSNPWHLGTPGTSFLYRWAWPERLFPPEGEVTQIDIDETPAPGRLATVHGAAAGYGAFAVRGLLTSLAVGPVGWRPARPPLGLGANMPGATVRIGQREYRADDLVRVEVEWGVPRERPAIAVVPGATLRRPLRVTLTFHHAPEFRAEDMPTWSDADVKGRALSILEAARYAPFMADVLAAREGVLLYWFYPGKTVVDDLAGFHVYRATGKAPSDYTRIDASLVPFASLPTPAKPPPGWPPTTDPAHAAQSVCGFEDKILGGAETVFFYRVTAVDTAGHESAPYPPAGVKVNVLDRTGPPAPVIVEARAKRGSGTPPFEGVSLSWLPPQYSYPLRIFRSEEGSTADPAQVGGDMTPSTTSFLDVGPFTPGKRYTYALKGFMGQYGKPSDERTVLVRPEDVPPGKSTLTATAEGSGIRLVWSAPSSPGGISGYIVERRRSSESVFRQRTERLTSLTFLDTHVLPDTDYVYRLVLIDGNGVPWPDLFPSVTVHTAP